MTGVLRTWRPEHLVLRAVLLLGPALALLAAAPAGAAPAVWALVTVLLLGLVHAAAPDSTAGALGLVVVVAWWALRAEDPMHPVVLLAALVVLVVHVAGHLAAAAPPETPLDHGVLGLWARRTVVLLAAAAATWLLARALDGGTAPGWLWPAALAAALVAVVAGLVAVRAVEDQR